MGKIETVKELKNFLRQSIGEEAYEKFVTNYEDPANPKDEGEDTVEDFMRWHVSSGNYDDLLYAAFIFVYTPEGLDYWVKINKTWREACNSL